MWLLKTNPTWASLLPRLILAITFIPAGWYKLSDFQSKSLAWSVNSVSYTHLRAHETVVDIV